MTTERNKAALPDLGPYGRLAYAYAVAGIPTFPVCPVRKKPLVRNYASRIAPCLATIEDWARRYPHANLGFATRRGGVVVLDADDPVALAHFARHVGQPVLRTLTPKGEHWWFADPGGRRRGGNRPTALAFDIKGAKACDFVILPGSNSTNGAYRLAEGQERDLPGLLAESLRRLTPLPDAAYEALMASGRDERPIAMTQTLTQPSTASTVAAIGLDRVAEGRRNKAVFTFSRRQCRIVRRELPDAQGQTALLARVAHYNQMVCDPPLEAAEVEKTALSAWRWDLANMQRLPANGAREIRRALVAHPGQARAVTLLLLLSATTQQGEDLVLAPARLAAAGAIPVWSQGDYRSAIAALVASGRLRIVERPRRGRGNAGAYRLAAPVSTALDVPRLLSRLNGDADAFALYGLLWEQWGASSSAGVSIRAMCAQRGGPFGSWDERRLRQARDRLEAAGLLSRHAQPRLGPRTPRAMFAVRSLDVPNVPKTPEIAPEDSHRPPAPGTGSYLVSRPAPTSPDHWCGGHQPSRTVSP